MLILFVWGELDEQRVLGSERRVPAEAAVAGAAAPSSAGSAAFPWEGPASLRKHRARGSWCLEITCCPQTCLTGWEYLDFEL